jgi:photosystem II stability/assembly factor-like uncharacterized protein
MRSIRFSLVLVLLILAAFSPPARAAVGRWTYAGPGGGEIRALAIDPSDPRILYAAASPGGVYTSRDRGAAWTWGAGRDLWAVAVDPAHPATVYAGGPGELLRSTDRGRTWTRLDPGPQPYTIEALAVAPGQPSTVYAANVSELLASTDRGETWSPVRSNGLAIRSIVVDPSNPDTIYLTSWAGVFKSPDAGAAWELLDLELSEPSALAVDPRLPSRLYLLAGGDLYRSDDGGASWPLAGQVPLLISRALAVDPGSPSTVWAAGEHGVFVSRDAGETWRPVRSGLPKDETFGINALAIDPRDPAKVYAGTADYGVARTWNAGRRWWLLPQRGLSAERIRMLAFDPEDPGTVYVTLSPEGQTALRSRDGGRTWEPFAPSLTRVGLLDVVPDPSGPGMLWASNRAGVWLSFDDGETWSRRDGTEAFRLTLAGPNVLASGRCGLRLGARNGRSWRQVLPCVLKGPEEAVLSVSGLLVDARDPAHVYAATSETIGLHRVTFRTLESRDSGRTWKPLPEGTFPAAQGSDGTLYALDRDGDRALRRSTDGGRTWSVVHKGGPQIRQLAVDAGDSRILYAATIGAGLLRSRDGGITWKPMNRGLVQVGRRDAGLHAHPGVPGLVYATADFGGLFRWVEGD